MKTNNAVAMLITMMLFYPCGASNAQSSNDEIVIRPGSPSTLDSIHVEIPVRACLLGDPLAFITATTTRVTGREIAIAVDQNGPSGCFAAGDSVTTKAFRFLIQPLSQGSYTVNFTRTSGAGVDLQRSSTVIVSAPFGATTLMRMTIVLLSLLLLVTQALLIAAPGYAFPRIRSYWASTWRILAAARPMTWFR